MAGALRRFTVETALAELRGLGDEEAIARVKASGGGLRRK
jgi:hypothetical protein